MSDRTFDRETLLDLTVNAIPLFMLLFFVLVFAVVTPFPGNSVIVVVQMGIIVLTAFALLVLTYYSGKAISNAESRGANLLPAGYSEEDAETAGVPGENSRQEH